MTITKIAEIFGRLDEHVCDTWSEVGTLEQDPEDISLTTAAAALLRLEIRYMRRDILELKTIIRDGLRTLDDEKAGKQELNSVADHEERIRSLEKRIYWALGFGAAAGAIVEFAAKVIFK